MFKKAQFRLFAIITGILLAVFIAVLGSVNIIMQSVMQRQSKDVLKKIAAGVEYDDRTKSFTITRPEAFGQKPNDRFEEPPSKPSGQPGTDETAPPSTAEETSTAEASTAEASTAELTSEAAQITTLPSVVTTAEPPAMTTAPPTEQVTTAQTTAVTATTAPVTTPAVTTTGAQPTSEQSPPTEPYDPWRQGGWGWGWGGEGPPKPPWIHDGGGGDGGWNWDIKPPDWGWQFPGTDNQNGGEKKEDTAAGTQEQYGTQQLAYPGTGDISVVDGVVLLNSSSDRENNPGSQRRENEQIPKSLGSIDFFIVMADKDGNFVAKLNNDDLDEAAAQSYISAILKEDVSSGMIDKKYQFYQMEKNNGTIMVFTDKSAEIDMLNKLIRTTILIGVLSLIVLAAAAFFLSRQVMKPLKSAFEKQKQFISDASHELKTPLTVISANADVLSGEIGDNKWLEYIKSQAERMNVLVNDLLNLTRLENNSSDFIRTDFDLSKAVVNTALPFECQAFESSKQFDVEVEEGLTVNGSERHIKQMTAIFIDNALKYSGEGGKVRVTLKKQGEKKVLTVFNTGEGVKEGEEEKIFERFYRSDESRNRSTGGYGLGLAIAKSIIDKHKFKVHVDNKEGTSIAFVVTM